MKNLGSIVLFGSVLLVILIAIFLFTSKKNPVFAPQTSQTVPSATADNSNADLQQLDSTDPNSMNSDLQQLGSASSAL